MRARALALLALALAAALPAGAVVEVRPGWGASVVGEDNVFRVGDTRISTDVLGSSVEQVVDRKEEADVSLYTGPNLGLRRRGGPLEFGFDYRLRYEEFVFLNGISDVEHFLNANASWEIGPRDKLSFSEVFAQSSSLTQQFSGELLAVRSQVMRNGIDGSWVHRLSPVAQIEAVIDGQLYDYEEATSGDSQTVRASLQLTRAFSPRQTVGLGAAWNLQEIDDTAASFADVDGRRVLITPGRSGTGATYYETFGIWRLSLTPTTTFSISAGPAWSAPDPLDPARGPRYSTARFGGGDFLVTDEGCPAGPATFCLAAFFDADTLAPLSAPRPIDASSIPSDAPVLSIDGDDLSASEGSLTYFGRASLDRRWERVTARLEYSRSASSSSGIGASTTLDLVSGQVSWTPRQHWRFAFNASWEHQTAATQVVEPLPRETTRVGGDDLVFVDAQGRIVSDRGAAAFLVPNVANAVTFADLADNPFESDAYRVELRGTREIGPRLSIVGALGYYLQDTTRTFDGNDIRRTTDADSDGLHIEMGFTWALDPIEL